MAATFGVDIRRCAYLGDSGVDTKFGVNSAMRRIGVRSVEELQANGAEVLVNAGGDRGQL